MSNELFIHAEEVAHALGVSKPYAYKLVRELAYKLVRELNKELKEKGFLTIAGRVNRQYFEEKLYGNHRKQ